MNSDTEPHALSSPSSSSTNTHKSNSNTINQAIKTHEEFTQWALSQGITIHGAKPHYFPGKGIGLRAERDFEPNTTIINIPISALLTTSSIAQKLPLTQADSQPASFFSPTNDTHNLLHSTISTQSLLALHLQTLIPTHTSWSHILPPLSSLDGMPFLWPPSLQSLLPFSASKLLAKQLASVSEAWDVISSFYDSSSKDENLNGDEKGNANKRATPITYEEFVYHFLLVNSRTFYYSSSSISTSSSLKKSKTKSTSKSTSKNASNSEANQALTPYLDLLNHSSHPNCTATLTSSGYTLSSSSPITSSSNTKTKTKISKGSELTISYGFHSEETLWIEYGFLLSFGEGEKNEHDYITLDPWLEPVFTDEQRVLLREERFWGDWRLAGGSGGSSEGEGKENGKGEEGSGVGGAGAGGEGRGEEEEKEAKEPCYKTQVAIRATFMSPGRWRRFINGLEEEDLSKREADDVLRGCYERGLEECGVMLRRIGMWEGEKGGEKDGKGNEEEEEEEEEQNWQPQKQMLLHRWTQILSGLKNALKKLNTPDATDAIRARR